MADNVTAPFTGAVVATDEISGVHYQKIKVTFGADDSATQVSTGNPFPVTVISPTGLTDTQLRASPVPVSGTVAVTGTFFQATQPVSGTFWQATQPVSIAATLNTNATLTAGELHLGQVGGYAANPAVTITRPADTTAYASGDLVANSTTAGSVAYGALTVARKINGPFSISRIRLRKSGTTTTNASFRVHFYRAAPTFANGDNGVFSTSGVANYLGSIDVTIDQAFTDGASGTAGFTAQPTIAIASGAQTIFWALEARAAYTPASGETFTLEPEVVQG